MSYGLFKWAILGFAKFLPNLLVKPLDLFDLSSLPIAFSLSIPVQHGSLSMFESGAWIPQCATGIPKLHRVSLVIRQNLTASQPLDSSYR
jgi:hypothetical protein